MSTTYDRVITRYILLHTRNLACVLANLYIVYYDNASLMLHAQESVTPQTNVEIFVVDDDPDISSLFCRAFKRNNYKVKSASSIKETLIKLANMSIDKKIVFIIDYKLNGENGCQLVDELINRSINGVYIMITAGLDPSYMDYVHEDEDRHEMNVKLKKDCNKRVDEWLQKPITLAELKRVVEKHI